MRDGMALAHLLAGSWRPVPPPLALPAAAVQAALPLLLSNGVEGLGWWRLRQAAMAEIPSFAALQDAYRVNALWHLHLKSVVVQGARLFSQAGIEPVYYKGWTLAERYPLPGLRPCGDIDITVPPNQLSQTHQLLTDGSQPQLWDLRDEFFDLPGRRFETVFARSRPRMAAEAQVRVLSHEDHLRLACRHFQRHGGRRALWLCDVALLIESRPPDFDWRYFLSGLSYDTEWAICIIGAAHRLLGTRLDDTPIAERVQRLPRWLIPSILYMWEHPLALDAAEMRRQPGESLWTLTRRRWFTPLQTAWRFNLSPRSPLIRPVQFVRFTRHWLPALQPRLAGRPSSCRRLRP